MEFNEQGLTFEERGYAVMRDWLRDGWEQLNSTAIMAYNDDCAYGVIRALADAGLEVPYRVSVSGFDGLGTPRGAQRLTTVAVPLMAMGAQAFNCLQAWMEQDAVPQTTRLAAQFYPGQTSAAPVVE